MSTTKPKPEIGDVVDKIGLGWAQVRYVISGGGVWFADGLELSLISSITMAVGMTFNVGPAAKGMLVSIVYMGTFFGNLLSGPMGDRYGRRSCILASYVLIFCLSMSSSFSPSYAVLACLRFCVGVSFGFGQPVWNVLATEIAPSKWRTLINAGSQSLFTFGEIFCYVLVYLDDPWMTHLNWRLLLQQGAVPSLVFFLIAFVILHESPYLLGKFGKKSEAQDVLKSMQRENCIPLADLELDFEDVAPVGGEEASGGFEFKAVFSDKLFSTTLIITWSCFVMNFVYYGALYAFPNILPGLSNVNRSTTPAMELIVGALWELPGYVLAVIFSMFYARKPVMKVYAFLVGISMFLFIVGVYVNSGLLWHLSFWSIKCFINLGYVVIYVYLGEVYPTEVRVTGGAVGMAGGRIGACIAPLAFELLTEWTGTFMTFFFVNGLLCLTNIPLIDLLPYETFNGSLSARGPPESYGTLDVPAGQRVLEAGA